jgi:tetratricopeptide (TPR) repeat protein
MKKLTRVAALFALALALSAGSALAQPAVPAKVFPWDSAQTIVKATEDDINKGGLKTVEAHVADLEAALLAAPLAYSAAKSDPDMTYVLTDGGTETLLALTVASTANKDHPGLHQTRAIKSPYPSASLYLGSYYNEVQRPLDALRVLDAGLSLPVPAIIRMGDHQPYLYAERGAALTLLKRWPEGLANYDQGLTLTTLTPVQKALLLRGRGFALVELGRLDEGEKAYQDALVSEPGNARATSELAYIARLKAGGAPTATGISLSKKAGVN